MVGTAPKPLKLFDRVRQVIRQKHYSLGTEKTYVSWMSNQR